MKIGALIPIRLSSERLPKKAIKLIEGKPAVHHLLDRAFESKYLDKENVIVCTTKDKSDDELVSIVEETGARVYRGSTDDIILRFWDAVKYFNFDAVIELDGDDICVDTSYIDYCLDALIKDPSIDLVICNNLPLGLGSKAIRKTAFEKINHIYKTEKNDTGFMYFFTKTGYCNIKWLEPFSDQHFHEDARFTLDYDEDLKFFQAIFKELYQKDKVFGIDQIIELLKVKPELVNINGWLNEEYMSRTKELVNLKFSDKDGNTKEINI